MSRVLSRALALAILVTMTLGLGALGSSSARADDVPPPAPTAIDADGTDDDSFFIPDTAGEYQYVRKYTYAYGDPQYKDLSPGHNLVTFGDASVTIIARKGGVDVQTWVLAYTNAPIGPMLPNTYEINVGPCFPRTDMTVVNVSLTNTAGEGDNQLILSNYWVRLNGPYQRDAVFDSIYNGDTGQVQIGDPNDEAGGGVWPGRLEAEFYDNHNVMFATEDLTIKSCDKDNPGDPDPEDPDPPTHLAKPKGDLKPLLKGRNKLRVIAKNKDVPSATKLRVDVALKGKVVKRYQMRLSAYQHRLVRTLRGKQLQNKGAQVKLLGFYRDHKGEPREWYTLDRATMQPKGSASRAGHETH